MSERNDVVTTLRAHLNGAHEWLPSQRLVMCTAEGPFAMETTYTWEAINAASTRMTLRNRGTPTGFSKLVALFMVRAMRNANRKDLVMLKQRLEQQAAVSHHAPVV